MKKLTAGIFATLLTMVSVDGAYAAIASKGYVDEQVGTVTTELGNKADKTAIADMLTKTEAGTTYATKESIADMETKSNASATYATKSEVSSLSSEAEKIANRVTTVSDASDDTHYPTAKAVWDVVQAETSDIASTDDLSALTTRVTTAEGEIDTLQTGKQDKNMGAGAANHVVITDETGNITSAATIEAAKVSGLANVAKTGAYGDLTGTPSLGTLASKSTITSADITDGTIAEADLNTTINASLDKADSAVQPSAITDMQVKANLTKAAGWDADKSSDTKYPSNAAVNAAITDATSDLATDSKMGDLSSLTTTVQTNLVGAINEVDANADAAKTAADAAQTDATQAKSDAAKAQAAAEAKIPLPDGECSNPTAKCVLVSNGTNSFEWEVIARDGEGE